MAPFAAAFPLVCRSLSRWALVPKHFLANMFSTVERGSLNTFQYRIFYKNETGPISPFHDIPLLSIENGPDKLFNMIVEIPRWTNAKMEISRTDMLNPIKQDTKKGQLRYVANSFPHRGYIWNYGALPQTWENPNALDEATGCKGDNDPIDVCEIGQKVASRGEIMQVKVLGILALIDEGETDWKIIAINSQDPLAPQLNDIDDVEKEMPGFLRATVEWFRIYKMPDGKPENQFAFGGEVRSKEFALQIIEETHKYWRGLVRKEIDKGEICCCNLTVENSPFKIQPQEAEDALNKSSEPSPPAPVDSSVDKWHYVHLKK